MREVNVYTMTDDKERADIVKNLLEKNDGYCPCNILKNDTTKCICDYFKNNNSPVCMCGLYTKKKIMIYD